MDNANEFSLPGNLSFGAALNHLRVGKQVAREGWNGKGMWLHFVSGDNWGIGGKAPYDFPGAPHVKHLPFIAMKTADNGFVPWLDSQTDILALDWQDVDPAYCASAGGPQPVPEPKSADVVPQPDEQCSGSCGGAGCRRAGPAPAGATTWDRE